MEPTARYGTAIGDVAAATIAADLGPQFRDEEVEFQYFEYQSREAPGFQKVFAIHLMSNPKSKISRLVMLRLRSNGQPVRVELPIGTRTVALIKETAAPIVRNTRYRADLCPVMFTDGLVIQVGVAWRANDSNAGFIAGEAFGPPNGTPAARLMRLGRDLRKVALGTLTEETLASGLRARVDSDSVPLR